MGKGLGIGGSPGGSIPSAFSVSGGYPVMKITGRPGRSAATRRASVGPSVPGIMTSVMTRSTSGCVARTSIAWSPSRAGSES